MIARHLLTSASVVLLLGCASCTPSKTPPDAAKLGARSPIGGACVTDASCEIGATCDLDDPGGQCTKKCTTSAECGASNLCEPHEKECFQACKTQADCLRPGYRCLGPPNATFCDVPEENEKP
ncbi:MAG: hypothetical protein ABJE95_05595 [Byssovorax sp.]